MILGISWIAGLWTIVQKMLEGANIDIMNLENIQEVCLSEASLLLKDINLGDNCLNYIARVADSCNFEICGFIADGKIFFI